MSRKEAKNNMPIKNKFFRALTKLLVFLCFLVYLVMLFFSR